MTVFSSFSFGVVHCCAVTVFNGKCCSALLLGLLFQAKFGLPQVAGTMCSEKRRSGDAGFNWSLFCDPGWNQHDSLSPPPLPPQTLLRERRIAR